MQTDSALHFTILSNSENCNEDAFFLPKDTFDESDELIEMDGNIFDKLQNVDDDIVEDDISWNDEEKSITDILWDRLKRNFAEDPLNNETVDHLHNLYECLSNNSIKEEEVEKEPVVTKIQDKISDLKLLVEEKRTSKLWLQFMDFVSNVYSS